MPILVTGATGYIGGRLVFRLLEDGHAVRVLVRDAQRLRGRTWSSRVEVIEGDGLDLTTWPAALAGIDSAYYLIHSMTAPGGFAERDLRAARLFGEAARSAHLSQIIYLGGLGDPTQGLSPHLISRHRVRRCPARLRSAGHRVPCLGRHRLRQRLL